MHNEKWLVLLTEQLQALGLRSRRAWEISCSFICFQRKKTARWPMLNDHGIICGGGGLWPASMPALTIGDEEANRAVVSACRISEMSVQSERVALIGIGLIGSSLAHVMRREKIATHITAMQKRGDTESGGATRSG